MNPGYPGLRYSDYDIFLCILQIHRDYAQAHITNKSSPHLQHGHQEQDISAGEGGVDITIVLGDKIQSIN